MSYPSALNTNGDLAASACDVIPVSRSRQLAKVHIVRKRNKYLYLGSGVTFILDPAVADVHRYLEPLLTL